MKLDPSKKYITENNVVITVKKADQFVNLSLIFLGSNGVSYYENGQAFRPPNSTDASPPDHIKSDWVEIGYREADPDPVSVLKIEVGKRYRDKSNKVVKIDRCHTLPITERPGDFVMFYEGYSGPYKRIVGFYTERGAAINLIGFYGPSYEPDLVEEVEDVQVETSQEKELPTVIATL